MLTFDYEGVTRRRYQDPARARRYHDRFAGGGLRHLRGRFVAWRERRTLHGLLSDFMPGVVLDVPAGTGKMAPVLAALGATVVAADISPQMLAVAREEYARLGHRAVEFLVSDAESIDRTLAGRPVDVGCCIRLLHRVPADARRQILQALARTAPVSVVSYSVTSPLQRLRCRLLRKKGALAEQTTRRRIEDELRTAFTVLEARPIARGVCSEWFFLAGARADAGRAGA